MKHKKDAKMSMLKKLKKEMLEEMGENSGSDLKDKMMVKVAGDSPEAIQEGLSKAEQILKMRGEMMGDEEDEPMLADAEEAEEDYEEELDMDDEELSKEEIEEMIAMLQSKLESMA